MSSQETPAETSLAHVVPVRVLVTVFAVLTAFVLTLSLRHVRAGDGMPVAGSDGEEETRIP